MVNGVINQQLYWVFYHFHIVSFEDVDLRLLLVLHVASFSFSIIHLEAKTNNYCKSDTFFSFLLKNGIYTNVRNIHFIDTSVCKQNHVISKIIL